MATEMCLGSEGTGIQAGRYVYCRTCDSWVAAFRWPVSGRYSDLVPVHDRPYTEAQEAEYAGRAFMGLMYEYRQARANGTLLRDPNRVHTTALGMARPRAYIERT